MALKSDFTAASPPMEKINESTLKVTLQRDNVVETRLAHYYFDFEMRVVLVEEEKREKHFVSSIPFSQMDPGVLQKYWQKLKDMKGNPPPLENAPAEKAVPLKMASKKN